MDASSTVPMTSIFRDVGPVSMSPAMVKSSIDDKAAKEMAQLRLQMAAKPNGHVDVLLEHAKEQTINQRVAEVFFEFLSWRKMTEGQCAKVEKCFSEDSSDLWSKTGAALVLLHNDDKFKKRAVSLLEQCAKESYAPALTQLGNCHRFGIVFQRNTEEARQWYWKAAVQGDAPGQTHTSFCIATGIGGTPDVKVAVEWLKLAAAQGYAPAQYNLGRSYEMGAGVAQDVKQASEWYKKAATQGDAEAQTRLKELSTPPEEILRKQMGASPTGHIDLFIEACRIDSKMENEKIKKIVDLFFEFVTWRQLTTSQCDRINKELKASFERFRSSDIPWQRFIYFYFHDQLYLAKEFKDDNAKDDMTYAFDSLRQVAPLGLSAYETFRDSYAPSQYAIAYAVYPDPHKQLKEQFNRKRIYFGGGTVESLGDEYDRHRFTCFQVAELYQKAALQGYSPAIYIMSKIMMLFSSRCKYKKEWVENLKELLPPERRNHHDRFDNFFWWLLEVAAEKGYAPALMDVETGSATKIIAWRKQAAAQGYPGAEESLKRHILNWNDQLRQEMGKEIDSHMRIVLRRHSEATLDQRVAEMFFEFVSWRKDAAAKWTQISTCFNVDSKTHWEAVGAAIVLLNGNEAEKKQAVAIFERVAKEEEYAPAQTFLATCLQNGIGTPVNLERAEKLFNAAARQDYSVAQYHLGKHLNNPRNPSRDPDRAKELMDKAGAQYYPPALYWLSVEEDKKYWKGYSDKSKYAIERGFIPPNDCCVIL